MLQTVRAEADRRGKAIAALLDLQGPKIRVGKFAAGEIQLRQGAEFTITTDTSVVGDEKRVSTSYSLLPKDVRPGDQILLDDGYLALAVTSVDGHEVRTVVVSGGVLKNNKGINLPGVEVSAPALSDKDKTDIGFALRHGVDYVALSFVRRPEDILEAKRLLTIDQVSIPGDREDREAASARTARRHHRCRGWRDGRAWRSRRRARSREGPAVAEADDRGDEPARQDRHHRDPDARVDDHASATDAR